METIKKVFTYFCGFIFSLAIGILLQLSINLSEAHLSNLLWKWKLSSYVHFLLSGNLILIFYVVTYFKLTDAAMILFRRKFNTPAQRQKIVFILFSWALLILMILKYISSFLYTGLWKSLILFLGMMPESSHLIQNLGISFIWIIIVYFMVKMIANHDYKVCFVLWVIYSYLALMVRFLEIHFNQYYPIIFQLQGLGCMIAMNHYFTIWTQKRIPRTSEI